jgi:hypothetical protein
VFGDFLRQIADLFILQFTMFLRRLVC